MPRKTAVDSAARELASALESASSNPAAIDNLLAVYRAAKERTNHGRRRPLPKPDGLPRRQAEAVRLARTGLRNREIAEAMGIAASTVKIMLRNARARKL